MERGWRGVVGRFVVGVEVDFNRNKPVLILNFPVCCWVLRGPDEQQNFHLHLLIPSSSLIPGVKTSS